MKYFKISEFDSPDAPGSGENMQESTLDMLDECREIADIPFIITSGYRTKEHNSKVGGVNGSSHTKGLAVDISVRNGADRFKVITAALEVGFSRIGISGNFIHLDNDDEKAQNVIWPY